MEKESFVVNIAGLLIEIKLTSAELKEYCKEYIEEQKPQIKLAIGMKDLENEKKNRDENIPIQFLENTVALRKIAEILPAYKKILFHGAVISWKKKGIVFTAPSGTGKTTHIALWKKYYKEDVKIINGDKPVLSIEDEKIYMYGTPWAGKERWHTKERVELHAICVLQRSENNNIKKMEIKEAIPLLLKQIYLSNHEENFSKALEVLDFVLRKIPVYLLECNISYDAVKCSSSILRDLE